MLIPLLKPVEALSYSLEYVINVTHAGLDEGTLGGPLGMLLMHLAVFPHVWVLHCYGWPVRPVSN